MQMYSVVYPMFYYQLTEASPSYGWSCPKPVVVVTDHMPFGWKSWDIQQTNEQTNNHLYFSILDMI